MQFKLANGNIVSGRDWTFVIEKIIYPEETGLDPEGNITTVPEYTKDEAIQVQLDFASDEELEGWGITKIESKAAIEADGKFYFVSGDADPIPRDLNEVKNVIIKEIKQTAANILQSTDWIIIRAVEQGEAVEPEILESRAAIREKSNQFELQALSQTSIESLEAWYKNSRNWD